MAFTNEGTIYRLSSRQVPNDFENASVNQFQDYENDRIFQIEVDRDTVKNADPATTMANILNNPTIGVNKQISDVFEEEQNIVDNDVSVWSAVEKMVPNIDQTKDSDLLTDADVKFILTVRSYYKNIPGGE